MCRSTGTNYEWGLTATRKNSLSDFNNAVLIAAQSLENGKMFEVRIEEKISSWSGSITIGCTTSRPEAVSLPNSLSGFGQDSWIVHGFALLKHGRQRINDYGRDSESLDKGDAVGIARVGLRKLKFYVNGKDQGTTEDNLPPVVYPMVDLYGKCTQVCIVSPGKLYSNIFVKLDGSFLWCRYNNLPQHSLIFCRTAKGRGWSFEGTLQFTDDVVNWSRSPIAEQQEDN